jgi:hypothetical protein
MAHYTGGCLCGAIRYEISAEPMISGYCQCRDCQRTTGAGHASLMGFPEQAVQLTGTPKYHAVKAESGNTTSRGFCSSCGTWISGRLSAAPGMTVITAGSLDDPALFQPALVVFAKRANPWDMTDQALTQFSAMPPTQPSAP